MIELVALAGFFPGRTIPDIEKHIHIVVAVVIFLSLLPGIIAFIRARLEAHDTAAIPS